MPRKRYADMSPEERAHAVERVRAWRQRRREKRQAATLHQALVKATQSPVEPSSELGQALAAHRAGLLASLGSGESSEDQRALVSMAVEEKLLADSAAAYLATLSVEDWKDPRVIAIVEESRALRSAFRRTLLDLRDPRLKPVRAPQTWKDRILTRMAEHAAEDAAQAAQTPPGGQETPA